MSTAVEALQRYVTLVDKQTGELVNARFSENALRDVARYTTCSEGKRLRPALVCLAADAVGGRGEAVVPAACAIELLHAASLMLDDLPCMDNAATRRWQKSSHLVHGEAPTVLAAVGLIATSFGLFSENAHECGLDAAATAQLIQRATRSLVHAAEGQAFDLGLFSMNPSRDAVERCYYLKTGAVLALALTVGATLAKGAAAHVRILEDCGYQLGIAFQYVDDMFDYEESAAFSGKSLEGNAKAYLAHMGRAGASERARELFGTACQRLRELGPRGELLTELASWTLEARLQKIMARKKDARP